MSDIRHSITHHGYIRILLYDLSDLFELLLQVVVPHLDNRVVRNGGLSHLHLWFRFWVCLVSYCSSSDPNNLCCLICRRFFVMCFLVSLMVVSLIRKLKSKCCYISVVNVVCYCCAAAAYYDSYLLLLFFFARSQAYSLLGSMYRDDDDDARALHANILRVFFSELQTMVSNIFKFLLFFPPFLNEI